MKKVAVILISILVIGVGVTLSIKYGLQKKKTGDSTIIGAMQKRGTIIIGVDATYPPMESTDTTGNLVGFDIDIANEIAKTIGVKASFQIVPFDELLDMVAKGGVDIAISSISITPERANQVLFSQPYFNAGQAIVISATAKNIIDINSLRGKNIAAQSNTTSLLEAKKVTDAARITVYQSDYKEAIQAILKGSVDAIIMDYPAAANVVHTYPGTKLVGKPFTSEFYGVATGMTNTALIGQVNETIDRLKTNGQLNALESKWLR